ncbi:MAG: TetR/AcrR family transcriptional repressor of nem operon, partial [Myxococcota bacterium]
MRYPPEHKEESRRVLLEAARVLFRREGFERPSIDRITGAAGLTRGTFYAHFASKRALVAEVLALEPGLIAEVRDAAGPAGVRDVLRSYLEPARRTEVLD